MDIQHHKFRLIKIAILVSFLFCYLDWGHDQSGFIFQLGYEVLTKHADANSFMHPLVLAPFAGLIILLISIFLPGAAKGLTVAGMAMCGVLALMFLLVGILKMDFKIAGSTIPFLCFSSLYLVMARSKKKKDG